MRAIRLTVKRYSDVYPRTFLILESSSGDIEILREGDPRSDADRSLCVNLESGDTILAVEWAEL